ncbi:MAG: type II toxin-antitoxin system prevent-host-death family antitoxin [Planctomycetes bacterium]|nr:type II toxin-antitoxin system prevent-host-death family antitoxin [Planctomycetota bacterium]
MKASFVDLRNKSSEIIQALNRNEQVTVLYRGKPAAVMLPISNASEAVCQAKDHPAFGLWADNEASKEVAARVRQLRKGRVDAF